MKGEYETSFSLNTFGTLDAYLEEAPASALLTGDEWAQIHVSCTHAYSTSSEWSSTEDCRSGVRNDGSNYEAKLESTDPRYINRPTEWTPTTWDPTAISTKTQFWYSETQRQNDKRAAYKNPNYPWIESVHRFVVQEADQPQEWDIAKFVISGTAADSGEYFMHMVWGGYRDVVDIDLYPSNTVDIYGSLGEKEWVKIEHCQYPNYEPYRKCFYVEPEKEYGLSQCLGYCKIHGGQVCQAVHVVPLTNPKGIANSDVPVNMPSNLPPEAFGGARPIDDSCVMENMPSYVDPKTWYMCVTLVPQMPIDPAFNEQTENLWYVRDDPEDIIYYSTCYRFDLPQVFTGNGVCTACEAAAANQTTTDDVSQSSWQVGSECLKCSDAAQPSIMGTLRKWLPSQDCQKCV